MIFVFHITTKVKILGSYLASYDETVLFRTTVFKLFKKHLFIWYFPIWSVIS